MAVKYDYIIFIIVIKCFFYNKVNNNYHNTMFNCNNRFYNSTKNIFATNFSAKFA